MSSACISAADDNSTPTGATGAQDDGEGSTGDEEIDLDVTYDDGDDDGEASDDSGSNAVSVSLTKHATGIPIVMLLACLLLPILRRN